MTKRRAVCCVCLAFQAAWAAPVINYQGMVSVGGAPFSGTGYFKFQILNGSGAAVWSQDGSPLGGPPAGHLAVNVNGGIFHVPLGDPGLGMAPIPGVALHFPPIRLRTWFSTNTVNFEQLSPDINLQVPDLSFFDTGNLLVVDDHPGSDFQSLDAAFAHIATNEEAAVLLIMPGYYAVAGPLVMPSNRWTVIRGVDAGSIMIVNTNGPALVLGPGILRDVTVRGNPAVTDAAVSTNIHVQIADSRFERVAGSGPAFDLGSTGTVVECRNTMFAAAAGDAVSVSGGATLRAVDPTFSTWAGSGAGLRIGNGGACEISGARFWTTAGRAVLANGLLGYAVDIRQSDLNGGLALSNCSGKVNLYQCRIFSDTNRGAAVEVIGGSPVNNGIALDDCSIDCGGVPAGYVRAEPGERAWLEFRECRLRVVGIPNGSAGIVAVDSGPEPESARVVLFDTYLSVEGSGEDAWAIRADGAWIGCHGCKIQAPQVNGLLATSGADVNLNQTDLQGGKAGVRVSNDATVDMSFSQISGENGSAVEGVGAVSVAMQQCSMEGDGPSGIGVRGATVGGQRPTFFVIGSTTIGEYRALDFEDGTLLAANSLFGTETGLVARIARTTAAPQVQMSGCQMIRLAPAAVPAVVLAGNPAPTPAFSHCAFRATGAATAIGLDGAMASVISLVNSSLNTNLAAGITVMPATSLGNGNFIP